MKKSKNKALVVLVIALVVVLLASFAAQAFNTSGYSVSVSRIYFDTEHGTLSGLLYMPKGVSGSNPAPTLVTTHGYLNSAEMQDANAIEMSRRGVVVLALDQYDHGHSRATEENSNWMAFWTNSQYDAVNYMYEQRHPDRRLRLPLLRMGWPRNPARSRHRRRPLLRQGLRPV